MKRRLIVVLSIVFGLALTSFAAERYEVAIERGVAAKMRDGVTLRADVYRPKVEGKFPVLLPLRSRVRVLEDFERRVEAFVAHIGRPCIPLEEHNRVVGELSGKAADLAGRIATTIQRVKDLEAKMEATG